MGLRKDDVQGVSRPAPSRVGRGRKRGGHKAPRKKMILRAETSNLPPQPDSGLFGKRILKHYIITSMFPAPGIMLYLLLMTTTL
jgi:hypothetical protein